MQDVIKHIEVCFSTATYHKFHNDEANVVIVDILRATSAICSAFMNGVERIIPVSTIQEAKSKKDEGYLVAAERDGVVCDFADFGNSPFNFTHEIVKDKAIVYSTTNGTQAINQAKQSNQVIIGSYLNISAIASYLADDNRDIVIFCAGWKERFSLEDAVYAGALTQKLIDTGKYRTVCDSALIMLDIWNLAKDNLHQYIQKAAQKERLRKNGLDDCIEYCHTLDLTTIIPIFNGEYIESLNYCEKTNKKEVRKSILNQY